MKTSSPPKFKADQAISAANTQNTANAYQNFAFGNLNQTDPFGNQISYSQTGTDAQGNPVFNVSQTMGQTGQQFAGGLAGLGNQYFQGAGNLLNTPMGDSQGAFDQAYQYASGNLEPRFDQQRAALESRLANQGLNRSSEAYSRALNDLSLQHNEARNNLVTGIQGQLFNQGLQGRQQQANELTSLASPAMQYGMASIGGQYLNPRGATVQNTDVMGAQQQAYNSQMAAWQAKQQQQQAMMGGLASLGGSLLAAPMTGGGSLGGFLAGKAFGV